MIAEITARTQNVSMYPRVAVCACTIWWIVAQGSMLRVRRTHSRVNEELPRAVDQVLEVLMLGVVWLTKTDLLDAQFYKPFTIC
jgi:hypothetical protein